MSNASTRSPAQKLLPTRQQTITARAKPFRQPISAVPPLAIIGIWAEKRDVDVRGTRVEVNKTMAADPRRIGKIEVVFKMPARNYSDKEKIMMEKAARSCPVHLSLGADVEQVFTFIWQDSREDQPY